MNQQRLVGCELPEIHQPHFLTYLEGVTEVTCAGTQPPAELTHTPTSGIVDVTNPAGTVRMGLFPEDQHGPLQPEAIEYYVLGARAAQRPGRAVGGVVAASTLRQWLNSDK